MRRRQTESAPSTPGSSGLGALEEYFAIRFRASSRCTERLARYSPADSGPGGSGAGSGGRGSTAGAGGAAPARLGARASACWAAAADRPGASPVSACFSSSSELLLAAALFVAQKPACKRFGLRFEFRTRRSCRGASGCVAGEASGVVGSDSTTGELCIGLHAAAFDSGEGGDTTLKLFGVRRMRREIGDECLRRRVGDELGGDNMTEEKVSTRRPKALVTWSSQLMSL
jgi:hypothetical protein